MIALFRLFLLPSSSASRPLSRQINADLQWAKVRNQVWGQTGRCHVKELSAIILYEHTLGSLTFGKPLSPLKAVSLHVQKTGGLWAERLTLRYYNLFWFSSSTRKVQRLHKFLPLIGDKTCRPWTFCHPDDNVPAWQNVPQQNNIDAVRIFIFAWTVSMVSGSLAPSVPGFSDAEQNLVLLP